MAKKKTPNNHLDIEAEWKNELGGTKMYRHDIKFNELEQYISGMIILSSKSESLDKADLYNIELNSISIDAKNNLFIKADTNILSKNEYDFKKSYHRYSMIYPGAPITLTEYDKATMSLETGEIVETAVSSKTVSFTDTITEL